MKHITMTFVLLTLFSCESKTENPDALASLKSAQPVNETIDPVIYEIDTKIYSKMVYYTSAPTYFAYSFDVKCTQDKCFLEGWIYEGQNYQRTVYSVGFHETNKIELDRVGNIAIGEACTEGYGCLTFRLNGTTSLSVDDGVNCYKGNVNTDEDDLRSSLIGSTFFAQRFTMNHSISASACY